MVIVAVENLQKIKPNRKKKITHFLQY